MFAGIKKWGKSTEDSIGLVTSSVAVKSAVCAVCETCTQEADVEEPPIES